MEEIQNDLKEIAEKIARIETHIEYQKEQFERIEKALVTFEATKAEVHRHGVYLKGLSWVFGLIISVFSAKIFGKF